MMMMDSGSISSVSINFIRSRRCAGARGSRIHAVMGDSFCGVVVVVVVVQPAELYIVRLML